MSARLAASYIGPTLDMLRRTQRVVDANRRAQSVAHGSQLERTLRLCPSRRGASKSRRPLCARCIRPGTHRVEMELSDGVLTLQGEVPAIRCTKLALEANSHGPRRRGIVDRPGHVAPTERAGDGVAGDAACELLLPARCGSSDCTLRAWVKGSTETLWEAEQDSCAPFKSEWRTGSSRDRASVISLAHSEWRASWHGGPVVPRRGQGPGSAPPRKTATTRLTDALAFGAGNRPLGACRRHRDQETHHVVTLKGSSRPKKRKKRAELDAWTRRRGPGDNDIEARPEHRLIAEAKLRNVGVIADIDAGKTTTTDCTSYYTGRTHRPGSVDDERRSPTGWIRNASAASRSSPRRSRCIGARASST